MFRRIKSLLGLSPHGSSTTVELPALDRSDIAHLLRMDGGLPHVDWGAAAAWIARSQDPTVDTDLLRRAIAARWLDELRDALTSDHRRWQRPGVEGLGPLEGSSAIRAAKSADDAISEISRSLALLRGLGPIPPVGVIALATQDDYYSVISHYYDEEGEFATSGGIYINRGEDSFPLIVLPVQGNSVEATIAHEMTHHALRPLSLPNWLEEGLTQMMEERVTRSPNFKVDREIMQRHYERWSECGLQRYWDGESFQSPNEDEQELAYHLSQMIVRTMLSDRPKEFFAFARACGQSHSVDAAAHETLGFGLEGLVTRVLGPGDWQASSLY